MKHGFLAMSADETPERGFDVILVTADAYVDHPSFGTAIIGRWLESLGVSCGIISQPDWHKADAFKVLGRPNLFFGVTAGNLDSMVAMYTASRKLRSEDAYSPGGRAGLRPYLPSIVYSAKIREAFGAVPIVLGGVEASLRRTAHYDYYTDTVRRSILLDAKADLLVYGNAERPLEELVGALRSGAEFSRLPAIRGTVIPLRKGTPVPSGAVELPSFEEAKTRTEGFREMTKALLANDNPWTAVPLVQRDSPANPGGILVRPPAFPLETAAMDRIYGLEFMRKPHPSYKQEIPALRTVVHSVTAHRGCFGGCSFCSLGLHQGRFVQARSERSILEEVGRLAGTTAVVTDIGGPTANMYGLGGEDLEKCRACARRSCLVPSVCRNLRVSQSAYGRLLEKAGRMAGIKSVYVNSGVRTDLALKDDGFIRLLVRSHTQGQLSVAPEHSDDRILKLMNKPAWKEFQKFRERFAEICSSEQRRYYLMPYFIIGHPGADDRTEALLAEALRQDKTVMDQVQEFYPLPMTLSAMMYHTGTDLEGRPVAVEKKTSRKKTWKENALRRPGRKER
jgi:uncharacterized radical SAM protein YgiQ